MDPAKMKQGLEGRERCGETAHAVPVSLLESCLVENLLFFLIGGLAIAVLGLQLGPATSRHGSLDGSGRRSTTTLY
jgi:hypothetical protein